MILYLFVECYENTDQKKGSDIMKKWSNERKRKHKLIMQESIKKRRYDEIIKQMYNNRQEVISILKKEDYLALRDSYRINSKINFTQTLKNKVKARDNNKCQDCGRKPSTKQKNYKYFEVHHKDGININNDMSNLILLCKKCHQNRHHNESKMQYQSCMCGASTK